MIEESEEKVKVSCPAVICEYNTYMGAVDLCGDQMFLIRLNEGARSDFTFKYSLIFWTLVLLIRKL